MGRAPFRFRRILRLKSQLRRAAQDEIAGLRRDLAEVRRGIDAAAEARQRARALRSQASLAGVTAGDLQLYESYDRGQDAAARRLGLRAEALEQVIEERRRVLLERRREERQFEVLETRQRDREAARDRLDEANLQDDLARRCTRESVR